MSIRNAALFLIICLFFTLPETRNSAVLTFPLACTPPEGKPAASLKLSIFLGSLGVQEKPSAFASPPKTLNTFTLLLAFIAVEIVFVAAVVPLVPATAPLALVCN